MRNFTITIVFKNDEKAIYPTIAVSPGEALIKVTSKNDYKYDWNQVSTYIVKVGDILK